MSEEIKELKWEYEDQLPEIAYDEFAGMFNASDVINGVRMYPYIEINGKRIWLSS